MVNYGLKFKGTNSSGVIIPYTSLLHPTDMITLESWVYIDNNAINKSLNTIISTTQSGGYSLIINSDIFGNGKFGAILSINGSYQSVYANNSLFIMNHYNHIAMSFDKTTINLYLNGKLINSKSFTGNNSIRYSYNNAFVIGNDAGASNNGFDGGAYGYNTIISDVRVWNIVRTENEIYDNMNKNLSGNETGLVGYWKFDEGDGNIVYDSSPNKLNGNIYNSEWVIADLYMGDDDSYLIKQNNDFYSIDSRYYLNGQFIKLPLEGGLAPNVNDFKNLGFDNISIITKEITINNEIFKPIDKFDGNFNIFMYK